MVQVRVSLQNSKFTLISNPYFLKWFLRSVKHGLSYDLKGNQRSDQKIYTLFDKAFALSDFFAFG